MLVLELTGLREQPVKRGALLNWTVAHSFASAELGSSEASEARLLQSFHSFAQIARALKFRGAIERALYALFAIGFRLFPIGFLQQRRQPGLFAVSLQPARERSNGR